MIHLKDLEVQEQAKPTHSWWQEIIMIRVEINEMETKITIHRVNQTNWFFERFKKKKDSQWQPNQTNQKRKEKEDSNKYRDGKGSAITNLNLKIITEYFEKVFKKENLEEMYSFPDIHMTYQNEINKI